ncbi:ABC transporter ATP-binding protein [Aeromicrobium sp. 9AM]|uniref:ABC transporter ATP-binding protein n=1 Tax=Aeromicrobium sp. 9AM TaxID=2653126 RepID=UPI00135694C4|nr:ATP-binding cassette domain-containing protein [Aeromicrobium sp. 9AM]
MSADLVVLRTDAVTVKYGALAALADVSLGVATGSITGITGPNGAGKSTLLNVFAGLTHISAGEVWLEDEDVTSASPAERVHRGLMRSFQTVRLLEDESVLTNVLVGLDRLPYPGLLAQLAGTRSMRRAERAPNETATEVLQLLGLNQQRHRPVSELPFASRRLVEIGRVLVSRPSVMLLDEPAAGLDEGARRDLEEVLLAIHASYACTVVLVEHDVGLVRRLCSEAFALDAGRLIAAGPPGDVLSQESVRLAYFGSASHD